MWNSISHKTNAPVLSIQLVTCLKGMRQLIGSSPPVSASSQRIPFLHQTVSGKVRSSGQLSGGPEAASVAPWRMCLFCEQWNTLLNKQQNRKKKKKYFLRYKGRPGKGYRPKWQYFPGRSRNRPGRILALFIWAFTMRNIFKCELYN